MNCRSLPSAPHGTGRDAPRCAAAIVNLRVQPTIETSLARAGGHAMHVPGALEQVIASDIETYARAIEASGARPDR